MGDVCGAGRYCSGESFLGSNQCTNCPAGYTCPGQEDVWGGEPCFAVDGNVDNSAPTIAKACVASSSPSDDGSDGNFYCINGGEVGGITGSCTCTSCNAGFSGSSCDIAGPCVATSSPLDDGSTGNLYCVNGNIQGTIGSCKCACHAGFFGTNCTEVVTTCDAGSGYVLSDDVSSDPCACDMDGIIDLIDTGRGSCKDHGTSDGVVCYVSDLCSEATPSGAFPGTRYRSCDPSLDNTRVCAVCEPGKVSKEISITWTLDFTDPSIIMSPRSILTLQILSFVLTVHQKHSVVSSGRRLARPVVQVRTKSTQLTILFHQCMQR
jgi:hypothetical protein